MVYIKVLLDPRAEEGLGTRQLVAHMQKALMGCQLMKIVVEPDSSWVQGVKSKYEVLSNLQERSNKRSVHRHRELCCLYGSSNIKPLLEC